MGGIYRMDKDGCGEEGVGAMWKQGGRSGECRDRRERERWKGCLDV